MKAITSSECMTIKYSKTLPAASSVIPLSFVAFTRFHTRFSSLSLGTALLLLLLLLLFLLLLLLLVLVVVMLVWLYSGAACGVDCSSMLVPSSFSFRTSSCTAFRSTSCVVQESSKYSYDSGSKQRCTDRA
jgi:hypothetical protein